MSDKAFKVGDRVRVVRDACDEGQINVGRTGTVAFVWSSGEVDVDFGDDSEVLDFSPDEIERIDEEGRTVDAIVIEGDVDEQGDLVVGDRCIGVGYEFAGDHVRITIERTRGGR